MKANELMVGNTLHYITSERDILTTDIDWQDLKWISENEEGFNVFHKPIPITEEWLLMLGFVFDDDEESAYLISTDNALGYLLVDLAGGTWFQIGIGVIWTTQIEIEFVHQLQNLYFAITGKKLQKQTSLTINN